MRSFELLKKAIDHAEWEEEIASIASVASDLLDELDKELTSEDYDEGEKVVDLCDKLEGEIREADEAEEEEDDAEEDEDEDEDEDDEFEGIDDDDEDEEQ